MAVQHVFSNAIPDFTGTVTGFNSQGSTTTLQATQLVRPSDWNSFHNQIYTLTGNTSNSSVVSGTNVVLEGGSNITLVGTGSTIRIVGAAGGGGGGTATLWWPFNEGVNVGGQQGQATLHIVPVPTPAPAAGGEVEVDRVAFPIFFSNSSNSTGSVTLSMWMGLYTRDNTRLSLAHSTSFSTAWTFSGTVSSSQQHGIRLLTVPWTTSIGDGRYFVAVASRSTTAGGNGTLSQILLSQLNSNFSGLFGAGSNASNQWPLGYGVYSASTTAIPVSIAFSEIRGTASLAARPPSWFMVSGTA